jgi:hypothetical protein
MIPSKPDRKTSSSWLAWGFIFLLAGGVLATKMLLLVDNDLEIKTKFAGKNWQLDSQSIRKSVAEIEQSSYNYFSPIGNSLRQQSTQLFVKASNARIESKDMCVVTTELAKFLAQVKDRNPVKSTTPSPETEAAKHTISRADRITQVSTHPNTTIQIDLFIQNKCAPTALKK